ncbi:lipoprotein [Staphylococcus aureus]|nr:lipoprotein [Staphylococcus aureus]
MKKRLLLSTFLASTLILTGCASDQSDNEDHHTSTGIHAPKSAKKLETKDIFNSDQKNKQIIISMGAGANAALNAFDYIIRN